MTDHRSGPTTPRRWLGLLLLALLAVAPSGGGDGEPEWLLPRDSESAIHTHTAGRQHSPLVTATADGFLVVWQSDGDRRAATVFGRSLDASGKPLAGETVASRPRIERRRAGLADGERSVEVEERYGSDGDGWGLVFQVYDEIERPVGEARPVNLHRRGHQTEPAVAALGDGGFFVVWQSDGQDGDGWGVFGRRFAADGHGGRELQLNAYTAGDQQAPSVAVREGERLFVVWQSDAQDGDADGIFGRGVSDLIFADGFESGNLAAWSSTTAQLAARFTASSRFGFAALDVTFDAAASFDPDGTIVAYDWDFGDTTTGTGVAPSHTYAAGNYLVTLTVTDNHGNSAVASTTLTVLEPGQAFGLTFTVRNAVVPGLDSGRVSGPGFTVRNAAVPGLDSGRVSGPGFTLRNAVIPGLDTGQVIGPGFTLHNQALPQLVDGTAEAPYFTVENQGGS